MTHRYCATTGREPRPRGVNAQSGQGRGEALRCVSLDYLSVIVSKLTSDKNLSLAERARLLAKYATWWAQQSGLKTIQLIGKWRRGLSLNCVNLNCKRTCVWDASRS